MRVLICDDEKHAIALLKQAILEIDDTIEIHSFMNATTLLEEVNKLNKISSIDIVFLDIEMHGMNGIQLARKLKQICPSIKVVFVTGYSEYALDAWNVSARGYLLKPIEPSDIQRVFEELNLGYEVKKEKKLRIMTFGKFEVFADGKPVVFKVKKAKEILALLVDLRGATISTREIASTIWEDKPYSLSVKNQTTKVVRALESSLESVGASEVLIRNRNSLSLHIDAVDCDYYRFLQGDVEAINLFQNSYMTDYSWAEFTLAALQRK